jgi:hypothetical protein
MVFDFAMGPMSVAMMPLDRQLLGAIHFRAVCGQTSAGTCRQPPAQHGLHQSLSSSGGILMDVHPVPLGN